MVLKEKNIPNHKRKAEHFEKKGAPKKVAIALQGGGAHGAFTWGVLDRLLEGDLFEIEGVSGTSAGGMNATALIQGLMQGGLEGARESLSTFWHEISELEHLSPFRMSEMHKYFHEYNLASSFMFKTMKFIQTFISPYQMNPFNINFLRDFLSRFFDFENLRQFKDSKLFLCATHVTSGKLRIFKLPDLKLEVMLASACLPSLFHAIQIDGEHYWDGGFVGNPAIYPLIYECQTSDIIVIQLTPTYRKKLPYTSLEIVDRHKEITYNACLMREMRSIIFVTDLLDKGIIPEGAVKRLNVHLIRDQELFQDLDISSAFNTNWEFLVHLFDAGRKAGDEWIRKHYEDVGKRGTAELKKDFSDF